MRGILLIISFFVVSCASDEVLRVRQFHLRETEPARGDLFIRAEMAKRLHGAVSEEERMKRRGQFYDVRWQGLGGEEAVKVVFEYRQAATGGVVKRKEFVRPAARAGSFEIAVTGEDYFRNGSVRSWRIRLFEGEREVARKQSYLWE